MELQSYSLKFVVVIIGIFFGIVTELTTFFLSIPVLFTCE